MHVIQLLNGAEKQLAFNRAVQAVAGEGAPFNQTGFCLGVTRLAAREGRTPWAALPDGTSAVYFVLQGRPKFKITGSLYSLRALHAVRVDGGQLHMLMNHADSPALLLYILNSPARSDLWSTPEPTFDINAEPPKNTVIDYPELPERAFTVNLNAFDGLHFPAGRWGRAITNGASPLKDIGFSVGLSLLHQRGSQVPWHEHPDRQNEVYLIFGGQVQMVIGDEVREVEGPAAVFIPGDAFHQVTNIGDGNVPLIYCYEGNQAPPHWRQELKLDGQTLPAAESAGVPPLPAGAFRQCTAGNAREWFNLIAHAQ